MISRTFASVFPRQSPSSLIFSSMNAEADSTGALLLTYSSKSRYQFSCTRHSLQTRQAETSAQLGEVRCSDLSRRSFRKEPSNDMAFPHPQTGKDHDRNEDKPGRTGVLREIFERTINIADNRNAQNDVNPAKNPTWDAWAHGICCTG